MAEECYQLIISSREISLAPIKDRAVVLFVLNFGDENVNKTNSISKAHGVFYQRLV